MHKYRSLKLKITLRCDSKCSFCNLNGGQQSDMTVERAKEIGQRLAGFHFDKVKINGGEPTLNTNLSAIASELSRAFPMSKIVLGTHGNRLLSQGTVGILDQINQLYLSCDDEHANYQVVEPILKACSEKSVFVIIQALSGFINDTNRSKLVRLTNKYGYRYSESQVVVRTGALAKRKSLPGPCFWANNNEIIVLPDGDIHLCCKKDLLTQSDSYLASEDLFKKLTELNTTFYQTCASCPFFKKIMSH